MEENHDYRNWYCTYTVGYFVVDAELPIEKVFNLITILVTLKLSCQTHCC